MNNQKDSKQNAIRIKGQEGPRGGSVNTFQFIEGRYFKYTQKSITNFKVNCAKWARAVE